MEGERVWFGIKEGRAELLEGITQGEIHRPGLSATLEANSYLHVKWWGLR